MNRFWYQKPLRILQTVLREVDAIDYDPDAVVAYLKKARCNTLVINGGGIFDFFQNPLECASLTPFMKDRDILRDISEACRKSDIRLIVRVDFRGVEKRFYDRHPDWFARDENGSPIVSNAMSLPLYAPCYESYYRNEHSVDFLNYLLEHYQIDGIWHNAVLCRGICYCDRCRKRFFEATGRQIPSAGSDSPAALDEYWKWKSQSARRNLELLRKTVKEHGADKAYAAEVFNMFDVKEPKTTGIDLYQAGEFFDFLVAVAFLTANNDNPRYEDLGYASTLVRFLKAIDKKLCPVVLFGGNGTSYRYVMDPPLDTRVWLREAASIGGGFWNCYFNGMHPLATNDRRNALLPADTYGFIEANEDLIVTLQPAADIAIYYSKPSKDYFGSDDEAEDAYCAAVRGMVRVLLEEHIQFSFLTDRTLDADHLKDIKVLGLPNAACLSDAQCRTIDEWVGNGGRLLATFQTSLFDEDGNERKDFGLSDSFGCTYSGSIENTRIDCFQYVDDRAHPILSRITATDMVKTAGKTVICAVREGTHVVTRHIPKIVNQPPERAYRDRLFVDAPVITARCRGKGKSVYFANQADALCYSDGHEDFRNTLAGAFRFLLEAKETIKTDAPESVHIALTFSDGIPGKGMIAAVNHSSTPYRPLRSLVPIRGIRIEADVLPDGGPSRTPDIRILSAESPIRTEIVDDRLIVWIEELKEFAAISFDFGSD